jgi:uncharacterized membrane protein YdjX (TVP38/TMEM64 family)
MKPKSLTPPPQQPSFFRRYRHLLLIALVWLLMLGVFWFLAWHNHRSAGEFWRHGLHFMSHNPYGVLILLGGYLVAPMLLVSTALLAASAGFLYGAVGGFALAFLGVNLAAAWTYFIGRKLNRGEPPVEGSPRNRLQRWMGRLRRGGFETALIMYLLFVPFELITYLSGFVRVPYRAFASATLLGTIPGTLTAVLFGASLHRFNIDNGPKINLWALAGSALIFAVSLLGSRALRRRQRERERRRTSGHQNKPQA